MRDRQLEQFVMGHNARTAATGAARPLIKCGQASFTKGRHDAAVG
jgi:hypothetical protein